MYYCSCVILKSYFEIYSVLLQLCNVEVISQDIQCIASILSMQWYVMLTYFDE